jgi:pimeloyl-ACP methyl ester carboxylesterase
MTRTRKRILVATLALLVVLTGWFYWFYFMSTNAAIRHAESFLFRRMTVSQVGVAGEYRHFFVTNRELASGDASIDRRFNSDRGNSLTFGYFDTSIRPTLGLGMIVDATQWFQNEEIKLDHVENLERDNFVERLRAVVDKTPQRSLLIVIHGFRERFPSALRKTAFIASVLDINTPVLVFDWPGDQGSSLRGYRASRAVAIESGADLARALQVIVDEIQPDDLSLIANSMGDLIVYVSSNDRALLMARLINREKRAGESTLSPDMLDEAAMISRLVDPDSDLISIIDVTPVNRTRNFHNFSLETPEYYDDLYLRLTSNDRAPLSRLIYRVRTSDDSEYWVLTRGR